MRTREKIRTGVLLDIADRIANGEVKDDARMLAVRMSAITTLLRKTLPDLTATDITSQGESVVVVRQMFKRGREALQQQQAAESVAGSSEEQGP